jgi:hypothetical protein
VLSTVELEKRGLPAVAIVTESFADLARQMAEHNERPGLNVLVLPYPIDHLPEEEIRAMARDHYPRLLELLGATR